MDGKRNPENFLTYSNQKSNLSKVKSETALIKLPCGRKVIIDSTDHDWISKFVWHFSNGYAIANGKMTNGVREKRIKMHRMILGCRDGEIADHINGNTLDNRRENLRICDHTGNSRNGKRTGNKYGYPGVMKDTHNFYAQIRAPKRINIGPFKTAKEAGDAYLEASKKYHGEFSVSNRT